MGFLKKDYNRHSSYNTAVTCFRIAIAVFIIAGLVFAYKELVYKPEPLTFEGRHTYTVTKLKKETFRTRRRITYHYYVTCTDEEGVTHQQTITSGIYSVLREGESYPRTAFTKDNGVYFISWSGQTDPEKAAEDYYDRFPDTSMIYMKWAAIIIGGIGVLFVGLGLGERAREKKFMDDTAIMRTGDWRL